MNQDSAAWWVVSFISFFSVVCNFCKNQMKHSLEEVALYVQWTSSGIMR